MNSAQAATGEKVSGVFIFLKFVFDLIKYLKSRKVPSFRESCG